MLRFFTTVSVFFMFNITVQNSTLVLVIFKETKVLAYIIIAERHNCLNFSNRSGVWKQAVGERHQQATLQRFREHQNVPMKRNVLLAYLKELSK